MCVCARYTPHAHVCTHIQMIYAHAHVHVHTQSLKDNKGCGSKPWLLLGVGIISEFHSSALFHNFRILRTRLALSHHAEESQVRTAHGSAVPPPPRARPRSAGPGGLQHVWPDSVTLLPRQETQGPGRRGEVQGKALPHDPQTPRKECGWLSLFCTDKPGSESPGRGLIRPEGPTGRPRHAPSSAPPIRLPGGGRPCHLLSVASPTVDVGIDMGCLCRRPGCLHSRPAGNLAGTCTKLQEVREPLRAVGSGWVTRIILGPGATVTAGQCKTSWWSRRGHWNPGAPSNAAQPWVHPGAGKLDAGTRGCARTGPEEANTRRDAGPQTPCLVPSAGTDPLARCGPGAREHVQGRAGSQTGRRRADSQAAVRGRGPWWTQWQHVQVQRPRGLGSGQPPAQGLTATGVLCGSHHRSAARTTQRGVTAGRVAGETA